jgi:hypothetical protein
MRDLIGLVVFVFSVIALTEIYHSIRMQCRIDKLPKTGHLGTLIGACSAKLVALGFCLI